MSKLRRVSLPGDHFTIVSNDWMRDKRLPWAARGLLAWMAGHTVDHEITEETIIEAGPAGRDGVRAMIRSLEECGYLTRERVYLPGGGSTVDYILDDPKDGKAAVREDGKAAVQSDQAKCDDLAGRPDDGKPAVPSLEEDQKKNKTPSVSKRAPRSERATRIPEGFQPDEKMRAWFAAEKLAQVIDGRWEHDKFVDYWTAEAGANARKLDWPATWRRWMREAAQRAQRGGYARPVSGPPGNSLIPMPGGTTFSTGPAVRPSTTDQKVAQTIELGRRLQQQMEETK